MLGFLRSGYQKIKKALTKTRSLLGSRLKALFKGALDEGRLEELECILYEADLGSACARDFVEHLRKYKGNDYLAEMSRHALEMLRAPVRVLPKATVVGEPLVILIVGVNGSGKTTSIAKLARLFQSEGKKVLLAAGDTFRAAAIDQLAIWAERLKIDIVKAAPGSDPSAVAFDALTAAKARGVDVVFIDTAGRLQNKTDLMQELEKIKRVCGKVVPTAPHETLLVLDATTGQNAIDQAQVFHQFTPLTGIVLTKLDGSAKGGIVLSIYKQLGIPVRWIGVGEGFEDLMPFEAESYVQALFDME